MKLTCECGKTARCFVNWRIERIEGEQALCADCAKCRCGLSLAQHEAGPNCGGFVLELRQ